MKFLKLLFVFFCCSLSVFSQKNLTISGTLIDENNEPVVAGNVELLAAKDSAYVAGITSNLNGVFTIKDLAPANYILKVVYLGFLPFTQNVNLTANQNLGKLTLKTNEILLKETIIEGKRPEIVVNNDTTEYDVKSFKTPENSVIEDLIKRLPGGEVSDDGAISINGKTVAGFLLNGKEFFQDDPQIASKNIPVDMIEKVKVFERKSDQARMTGFDDGEEQTFIDLKVQPGMMVGTTGNATAGLGEDLEQDNDLRYTANAFINRMQDATRYTVMVGANNTNNMGGANMMGGGGGGGGGFGGFGGGSGLSKAQNYMLGINSALSPTVQLNWDIRYGGQERYTASKSEQTTLSQLMSQLDKTTSSGNNYSDNISTNANLTWEPNKQNTLYFRPNFRLNQTHSDANELSDRYDYDTMNRLINSQSTTYNKGKNFSFGGTLDYAYRFASKEGRVLSLNARGNRSENNTRRRNLSFNQYYIDDLFAYDDDRNQRSENDNNSSSINASLSYVEPVGHNNFIQLRYRYSYSDTKGLNSTYDILEALMAGALDTLVINPSQSRSSLRNSTEQRISLNFKMLRSKYDITFGFNVDPSNSLNETYQPQPILFPVAGRDPYQLIDRNSQWNNGNFNGHLINVMGDSLISSIPQNIVNFSPIINFNYRFDQRSNLRINYEGETNQPSANQLRAYIDESNPTNLVQGNPGLKPGYENGIRLQYMKFVPESQFMYNINANGNFSFNDIVSVTKLLEGGKRMTTYENINGNWNMMLMGMFNTPLKNKRFTIGNMFMSMLGNSNSYINEEKNTQKNVMLMDNINFNYRSDLFDIGINASINSNNISYSADPDRNQHTYNYGLGGNTTWYLPHNWTITSDIRWTGREGFADGYNISQTLWNASVTKQIFNKRYGVASLKLQAFDILQDQNNIMANTTTNGFSTSESIVLPSYFLASIVYRFSIFPKSSFATESDMRPQFPGGQGGRQGGGRPPGGAGGGRPGGGGFGGGRPF
jgi:hypothetical protein